MLSYTLWGWSWNPSSEGCIVQQWIEACHVCCLDILYVSSNTTHFIIIPIGSWTLSSRDINSQSRAVPHQRVCYLKWEKDAWDSRAVRAFSRGTIAFHTSSTIFVTVTNLSSLFLFEDNPLMPLRCVDESRKNNVSIIITNGHKNTQFRRQKILWRHIPTDLQYFRSDRPPCHSP